LCNGPLLHLLGLDPSSVADQHLEEAHGCFTSRTLSLVETGKDLWRGDQPSPACTSALVGACCIGATPSCWIAGGGDYGALFADPADRVRRAGLPSQSRKTGTSRGRGTAVGARRLAELA
jgi:hypothetical protein